jgi:mRNA (2'-O-methyladenosine-N6-)-methyltransferase
MAKWGYERVDDLVWVKITQLKYLAARGGRTGYLLNHSKEHCLVGVKGTLDPARFQRWVSYHVMGAGLEGWGRRGVHGWGRGDSVIPETTPPLPTPPHPPRLIDCDVVMAEVRETSRKPDEMYLLLERMCPGEKGAAVWGVHLIDVPT